MFLVAFATFFAIGFVVRRWVVILVPLVGGPVLYTGLRLGWWGYGTGENWLPIGFVLTAVSALGVAAGALVGRTLWGRP